jgi:hypothetical protein
MTIIEALKRSSLHISRYDRQLFWDNEHGWMVMEHRKGKRNSICIIETFDEEKAVEALLNEIELKEEDDGVVICCPLDGHKPFCSNFMCRAEFKKDKYKSCKEDLGYKG